jgi:dolichyl-phosphate-mannose--protein O-mannosyl transferase
MSDIHAILFNAHIMFSVIMGVWAAVIAGRNQPISGNYWGAVVVQSILAGVVLLVGVVLTVLGYRPQDERLGLYYLYMAWLVVIMPGLFSMLRGRDDRSAALAFAMLAFFNAGVSLSMAQRGIVGPWLIPPVV